jgi:hypothetical protein
MRSLMAAATAAALFVSGAALAASADGVPASEPGQPQLAQPTRPPAQAAKPHKVAMRHRDRDAIGDRETAALNSLEASGYYTIKDVRPDGKNIAADAQKPGAASCT